MSDVPRPKKEKKESPPDAFDPNAWMATFSDLVTLLITFFVLLLTMSSLDSKALKDSFGFFNDRIGPMEQGAAGAMPDMRVEIPQPPIIQVSDVDGSDSQPDPFDMRVDSIPSEDSKPKEDGKGVKVDQNTIAEYLRKDRESLKNLAKAGSGKASRDRFTAAANVFRHPRYKGLFSIIERDDTLEVHLAADLLFQRGRVMIQPDSLVLLREVGRLFKQLNVDVRVVGIVGGPSQPKPYRQDLYPSQWDLAIARSCNVVRYITNNGGTSARRLGCSVAPQKPDNRDAGVVFRLETTDP